MAYTSTSLVIIHFILVVLLVESSIFFPESVQEDGRFRPLVEGFVYCKSNLHTAGEETLAGATPLEGATVSLNCILDKTLVVETTKTTSKGYFSVSPPRSLSHAELEQCKVYLSSSSPDEKCSILTDLNGGLSGADLQPTQYKLLSKGTTPLLQKLTVGPFAFHSSDASAVQTHRLKTKEVNPPCDSLCSAKCKCCYCSKIGDSCFCSK